LVVPDLYVDDFSIHFLFQIAFHGEIGSIFFFVYSILYFDFSMNALPFIPS